MRQINFIITAHILAFLFFDYVYSFVVNVIYVYFNCVNRSDYNDDVTMFVFEMLSLFCACSIVLFM